MSFVASRLGLRASSPAVMRTFMRRNFASEAGAFKLPENKFNQTRAAVRHHAAESSGLWYKLSYVTIPFIIIASINAWNQWNEHWEHKSHEPPRSEQPEYPYQNIRSKNFFWGDGDKTFFWNDNVNYHKKP